MLRRFFSPSDKAVDADVLTAVERLLRAPTPAKRSEAAMRQLTAELGGDCRALVMVADGGSFAVEATLGYPAAPELRVPHGPWRDPGPRLIANLVQELFTPNSREDRALLGDLGLRDAKSALVVPVHGGDRRHGALLVLRHDGAALRDDDLRRAALWGSVLGEAQTRAWLQRHAQRSLVEFTQAFIEALEARDFSQLGHARRVSAYALAIGKALELPRERLADLYFAAMLHDVGQLADGGDPTLEEPHHPSRGANLVASSPLLAGAVEGIRSHHEAWDGSGFPDGLSGKEIPSLGRIVAIADTFDLLSSERGRALPAREVEKALENRAGTLLDPDFTRLFVNILRQGRSTAQLARIREDDLPF